MKKVLSLVLAGSMVLSSMSMAFAATPATTALKDIAGNDYETAIEALVALDVVSGYEDSTFRPAKTITRAELAKLLVEALGYGDLVAGAKANFSDTQNHWSSGYVAIANGTGLVIGYPDGTFKPDQVLTYDEVYTMVIRALGYTDASIKGTWPTNFKVKAIDLGLTDDVKMATSAADRGGVAQALYNALDANQVSVDADNNVTNVVKGTVAQLLIDKIANKVTIDEVLPKHIDADNKAYYGDIVDLTPYMYEELVVYTNDDDEVVFVKDSESDVVNGIFEKDTASSKVGIDVDKADNEYVLTTSAGITVYYNGAEVTLSEAQMEDETTTAAIRGLKGADVKAILNADDEITKLVANKYTDTVQATRAYNGKATVFMGIQLPVTDGDVDLSKVTVSGVVDSLNDVEEDDVIVVYAAGGVKTIAADPDKVTLEVVRETVEGKVSGINKDGDALIDGTYYEISPYYNGTTIALSLEGTFYLDNKGDIAAYSESSSSDPADYAVVTDVLNAVYQDGRKLASAEIELVNAQGEEVTYVVDKDAKVDGLALLVDTDGDSYKEDVQLVKFAVIKYTVASDGEISKVTVEANEDGINTTTSVPTDVSSFVTTNNVLVFNLDGTDVTVADAADLGDDIDVIDAVQNTNGEYEMLFVKGLGSSETYAYFTELGSKLNADDEEVQEVVAYVNGVETTYLTTANDTIAASDVDNGAVLYKLTMDGDAIDAVTTTGVTADFTNATVQAISGNRVKVNNVWYTLTDDAAVYVLDTKAGVDEFDYVGDPSSVYIDAKVTGFGFDTTDSLLIDTLFIIE